MLKYKTQIEKGGIDSRLFPLLSNPLRNRINHVSIRHIFDASDSAVFQCFDFQICPTIVVAVPVVVIVEITPEI